jgi:anti-anti-sigma factor
MPSREKWPLRGNEHNRRAVEPSITLSVPATNPRWTGFPPVERRPFLLYDRAVNPVPFEVHSEEVEDGIRAFTVQGELDMNTAPELERALAEMPPDSTSAVILDLCECEFIDSTGIALIVRTWQRLDREAGGDGEGRLVLCSHNHQVRRLLEITGVERSMSLHERRDAALAELRG